MLKDFVKGSGYVLRGFKLVTKPGIRRFVIIPLLINSVVFSAVILFGAHLFEGMINSLLPEWLGWLEWLLWPLFAIIAMGIVFFTFTLLTNLLGAPFNGYLAAAIEDQMTGQGPEASPGESVFVEVLNSIRSEGRKLLYFLVRAIPILVLMLIPFTSALGAALWFLFGCWMLSIEYGDYPMANHSLAFSEQRRLLGSRRMMSLGFGATVMLLVLIPVVNFVAMPVAVAGATVMWLEGLKTTSGTLLNT